MNELKPEDLMKALECCAYGFCRDCVAYSDDGCGQKVTVGAIELIRSQDQKIKELTEEIERLRGALEAEERHNELTMEMAKKALANARADNVSEIKTRFAMRYGTYTDKDMTPITEVFRILDQIAKEMLEAKE